MRENVPPPPAKVWWVVYRWMNQQAVGRNEGFFSDRTQCEDFLHNCYISKFTPGEVLEPLAVYEQSPDGTWVLYDYSVNSTLRRSDEPTNETTSTVERRCATIPEHPKCEAPPPQPGEIDPAMLGVIPPAAYLDTEAGAQQQ